MKGRKCAQLLNGTEIVWVTQLGGRKQKAEKIRRETLHPEKRALARGSLGRWHQPSLNKGLERPLIIREKGLASKGGGKTERGEVPFLS